MNANERKAIENLPARATFGFQVAQSGPDAASGQYRVSGIMNSFGVMQSGRVLHPKPFEAWLKRSKGARLQMLAQHGFVPGFASIGKWDTFERDEAGMRWGGYIGTGTKLMDEARRLVDQKIIDQLSLGWMPLQARWVGIDDKDIDPVIKAAMEAAGAKEVYAIIDWYPVEGSLVDIADDVHGRLAADLDGALMGTFAGRFEETVHRLGEKIDGLEKMFGQFQPAQLEEQEGPGLEQRVSKLVGELFKQAFSEFRTQAIECMEAIAADPRADYAEHLLDADIADGGEGCGCAHGRAEAPREHTAERASALNEATARLEKVLAAIG